MIYLSEYESSELPVYFVLTRSDMSLTGRIRAYSHCVFCSSLRQCHGFSKTWIRQKIKFLTTWKLTRWAHHLTLRPHKLDHISFFCLLHSVNSRQLKRRRCIWGNSILFIFEFFFSSVNISFHINLNYLYLFTVPRTPSKLPQSVMLLTCIWNVPGSNFGRNIDYHESGFQWCRDGVLKDDMAASFHISSSSSFNNHPTIWSYIAWATDVK
jgi:hypothetical protein